MEPRKLVHRHYLIEEDQSNHLRQEAYKRKMSISHYLRMVIDDDMVGVEQIEELGQKNTSR